MKKLNKLKRVIVTLLAVVAMFTFGAFGLTACDNSDLRDELYRMQREIEYMRNANQNQITALQQAIYDLQNAMDSIEYKNLQQQLQELRQQFDKMQKDLMSEIDALQKQVDGLLYNAENCDLLEQIEKLNNTIEQLQIAVERLEAKLEIVGAEIMLPEDLWDYHTFISSTSPLHTTLRVPFLPPLPTGPVWDSLPSIFVLQDYAALTEYIALNKANQEGLDSNTPAGRDSAIYMNFLQNDLNKNIFYTHYLVRVLITHSAFALMQISRIALNGKIHIDYRIQYPGFIAGTHPIIIKMPRIINPSTLTVQLQ